jgi:hypothetical protein
MLLAILMFLCAASLPLYVASVLLLDMDFRFWEGWKFPVMLFALLIGYAILLVLTMVCLYFRAFSNLNAHTTALVTSLFVAILGLALLLLSAPTSQSLYVTAGRIQKGCSSTVQEVMILRDYDQVIHNIRMTPACMMRETVEECEGWAANWYTSYIKYLEEEYRCGPICPQVHSIAALQVNQSVGQSRHSSHSHPNRGSAGSSSLVLRRSGSASIQTDREPPAPRYHSGDFVILNSNADYVQQQFHVCCSNVDYIWTDDMRSMLGKTYRVQKVPRGHPVVGLQSLDGSQGGIWYFPATTVQRASEADMVNLGDLLFPVVGAGSGVNMFSRGVTRMACLPLVSTRLQVLAWAFVDHLFVEGCVLILLSITTSFSVLIAANCGSSGASVKKG